MNKYVLALLLLAFILINEAAPFLYNESYTIKDIKWGWVIGYPIIFFIASSFNKAKNKEEK